MFDGHLSDFHRGCKHPKELWRFNGSLIDVYLTSTMEIDVLWSYGGLMNIHWMPISMWVYSKIWTADAHFIRSW